MSKTDENLERFLKYRGLTLKNRLTLADARLLAVYVFVTIPVSVLAYMHEAAHYAWTRGKRRFHDDIYDRD